MTDKIQQARRELFEEWTKSEHGNLSRRQDGEYFDDLTHGAWLGFNAALDCVVIELPTPAKAMSVVMDYQDNRRQNVTGTTNWAANLGMCVVNECRAAIESTNLGIKVK